MFGATDLTTRRLGAAAVDVGVAWGLMYWLSERVIMSLGRGGRGGWLARLVLMTAPAVFLVFRDSLRGKSPGKVLFGVSAVSLARACPAGLVDSLVRNVPLGFLAIPGLGWLLHLGVVLVGGYQILMGRAFRVGDAYAGTTVILDRDLAALRRRGPQCGELK